MPELVQGGVTVRNANGFPAVAVALSSPIIMAGQSGAVGTVNYGESAIVENNFTTAANALFDRMWMRTLRRNGVLPAARMDMNLGVCPGIHGLVDPTTAKEPATLIMEEYFSGVIAVGACGLVVGIADHITPGDPTTLVGVGFKCDSTHVWHAFVNDCPTNLAPVTVRRDTVLAGKLSTDLHRLGLVIDGPTKTISWMLEGVVVDSWSPAAPLDRMGTNGPQIICAASMPANGDATIRYNGGGIPQLRLLVR